MKTGWWSIKKDADPYKCLVFPKEQGMTFEAGDLSDNQEIDLELFDDIVKSTIKLKDSDREHIVEQIKNGFTEGQVVQE